MTSVSILRGSLLSMLWQQSLKTHRWQLTTFSNGRFGGRCQSAIAPSASVQVQQQYQQQQHHYHQQQQHKKYQKQQEQLHQRRQKYCPEQVMTSNSLC